MDMEDLLAPPDEEDAKEIASYLIQIYGIEGALIEVMAGVERCRRTGNNHSLPIWREVRKVVRTN